MAMIQMPENFNPEYTKFYKMFDEEFTIQVQYRGIDLDDKTQKTYHYWAFKLLVGDELIVAGPFRHETEGRELTLEAVANNLASFYGYNIEGLIQRSREERLLQEALAVPSLDDIVELCKAYMVREHYDIRRPKTKTEYKVIHKDLVFPGGWEVVLEELRDNHKWYCFRKSDKDGRIHITSYVPAHKYSIDNL